MKITIRSIFISSLLAAASMAATAQPMMGENCAMPQGGGMGMRGKMDPAKMEAMVAKRQEAIKAKLKIMPDQEAAWSAFSAAMKPPVGAMEHKRPDPAEMAKLSTPERIDKMRAVRAERMQHMTAEMTKREDATKAFYAVLNAEQKKTFDEGHLRMMGGHGGHHGHQPWLGAGK